MAIKWLEKLFRGPDDSRCHTLEVVRDSQPTCVDDLLSSTALLLITPGRSGTKSLVDVCTTSTSMMCVHAPAPWIASIGYLYHQGRISSDAAKYGYYATREPFLSRAFQQQRVFFDGDCKNLPITLEIADLMPRSRFIHIVRKPERFIRSGLARGYYRTTPHELWGHLCKDDYRNEGKLTLENQIERIAYFWNEANRIAEEAKQRLGPGRVTTLVADEMFREPERIVAALEQVGLGDVVQVHRRISIRKLNRQAVNHVLSASTNELIDRVVSRECSTRGLYFE